MAFRDQMYAALSDDSGTSLKHNLIWGATYGFIAAVIFSAFALVITSMPSSKALQNAELTWRQVLCIYWIGGLAGGVILGFCRPLLRSLFGRIFSSYFILLPTAVLFEFFDGTRPVSSLILKALGMCAVLGPMYALIWHFLSRYVWKD